MRLSSSSSLVFAALAISSSSSTLSALAAPAGDPAQAKSGVSAPNNHFRAARSGSVSLPRSQADDDDETRSGEQVVKRGDLGAVTALIDPAVYPLLCTGPLSQVGGLVDSLLASVGMPICSSSTSSAATTASFGAESVNGDDASNSASDDPASWSVPTNTSDTSSVAPTATETPSRRDGPQLTTAPDKVDGTVDSTAPTDKLPINPVDKVDGTFDGSVGIVPQSPVGNPVASAPDAATVVVTGGLGTVAGKVEPAKDAADTGKKVPGTVIDNSPAPGPVQGTVGSGTSAIPVRRGNHERDVSPPSPPVQPPVSSAPVQPPISAAPSPPVQPPSASSPAPTTTIASTVAETAAPTPA